MLTKSLITLLLLASFSANAATELQKKMVTYIDAMASVYDSMYAPALWKKEFSNWTLSAEVDKAKARVLAKENITISEYHKIVSDLILSMKDFHVSVRFHATEKASLPFMVRGTEGRYFIVYIDREKLSKEAFPFEVGDELLTMNDKKADEIVKSIKATLGGNTEETDQALAEMSLTSRRAAKADTVPSGPITLTFLKDGKEKSIQLIWEYEKELVLRNNNKSDSKSLKERVELEMTSQIAMDFAADQNAANNFAIGARTSFLPALGTKIWESDKENHYDAYIYLNEDKELIGYVRIKSYGAGEKETKQFIDIIKKMQTTTDKLVIDQLNNPGGSVFYLYSLVSLLSDRPMAAPKHYMAINQEDIVDSYKSLKDLEKVKNLEELQKAFGGETVSGYPLSMNFLEFMKSYYQFKIDEWNAGKKLTSPYHLYGVDKINPHPTVQYTKPILLLVNELDFSGGDFFPAIMQDNKRATIMGVRTAGAGGYVLGVELSNQLGIGGFRYTGSLADRVDNTPIENLGVKPEIDYALTVEDYQKNFKGFKAAINKAVKELK
tara:strand:+ start:83855 stop:85510 length:1656 start_codon:yes stop_codon:yes gene_type:complete